MVGINSTVLSTSIVPALGMVLGAIIATIKTPSKKFTSMVQHFAAGVIFAAVAVELVPPVLAAKSGIPILLGFLGGMFIMLVVERLTHYKPRKGRIGEERKVPISLLTALGIDLLVDGFLIGISILAANKTGIILAIALGIELFFLGIAASSTLRQKTLAKIPTILVSIGLASLVFIGAIFGYEIIQVVSMPWVIGFLAFGIAALLYLVTEELLYEAHKVLETPISTMALFVGFLIVLLMDSIIA